MNEINFYKNIQSTNVLETIEISEWFDKIKNGTEHLSIIESARKLDKNDSIELEQYNKIKKDLPCITYNFLFEKWKLDTNIIESTGFLFFDIDDYENFNIDDIDKTYIYAYYKSLHNDGYHIIVKVNGIDKDMFKDQYIYISKLLGLDKFNDKYAIKKTQFSVLSFDSNIFINNSSTVIDFELLDAFKNNIVSKVSKSVPNTLQVKRRKEKCKDLGTKIENENELFLDNVKFSNKKDVIKITDNPYETNWDGWKIVECFFPIVIPNGKRYMTISAYCYNLKFLNPTMPLLQCKMFLDIINNHCINPLYPNEIMKIINDCYKKEEVIPVYTIKKIGYREDEIIRFNKEEKLEIARQLVTEHRIDMSKDKIYNIIEAWNFEKYGKISIRKISDNFPINKKTVAKYWSEFKEYVNELNKAYLEALSVVKSNKTLVNINK